jgi:hypothetical protein
VNLFKKLDFVACRIPNLRVKLVLFFVRFLNSRSSFWSCGNLLRANTGDSRQLASSSGLRTSRQFIQLAPDVENGHFLLFCQKWPKPKGRPRICCKMTAWTFCKVVPFASPQRQARFCLGKMRSILPKREPIVARMGDDWLRASFERSRFLFDSEPVTTLFVDNGAKGPVVAKKVRWQALSRQKSWADKQLNNSKN